MSDSGGPIDLGPLLAPISDDQPQGRDTRQEFATDTPYRRFWAARQDARDAEKRAAAPSGDEPPPTPNWHAVAEAAYTLIAEHGKDLEAAASLTEALLRTEGLPGLTAGATLIAGLVEGYWGNLFPGPDEDEPDEDPAVACMRPLAGLVSGSRATIMPPLRLLPLFMRPDGVVVTLADYDSAASIERLDPEQKERRVAAGAITLGALEQYAGGDPAGMSVLARDATAALSAWDAMDRVLSQQADRAKPNLGDVRGLLERIAGFATRLAPEQASFAPATAETDGQPAAGAAASGTPGAAAAGGPPGPIGSREEALRRLSEVAAWFRRTEPHSPLSYTLQEAERRGRLGLPELLAEVVPDYNTRFQILTALGIKPPPEESD